MTTLSRIQVINIDCLSTSEKEHDEIYLLCQADGGVPIRYPRSLTDAHSIEKGAIWDIENEVDLILNFEFELLITIWDTDITLNPQVGTYLASHQYCYNGQKVETGSHTASPAKNPNGAQYQIRTRTQSSITTSTPDQS